MEHTFNKKIVLNKHTKELPSTALHLAIEQENYDCMKLLVEHKADTDLINFRTLKPFELTYNDNIL
jgi:anoctamin-10